jgi:hypothetical protein
MLFQIEGGNMFSVRETIGLILIAAILCFMFSSAIFAANGPGGISPIGKGNFINPTALVNHSINPLRETGKLEVTCKWGNDILVAGGPMDGGFSADYDENGFIYAARCTTYADTANAAIIIYKSTDGGNSWFYLNGFGYLDGSHKLTYPYVLTGNNPSKLYIFSITSSENGNLGVVRLTKDGDWEGWIDIKAGADTISDFSVCTDDGSHLILSYQEEANSHKIYTIVSTDSGATWGNEIYVDDIAFHPDIAYGTGGYVYLVWEKNRDGDSEIWFFRNNNYCLTSTWSGLDSLTANSNDDTYPKIAVLHSIYKDTACVWVVYNHYAPTLSKVTNIDLNYAYSTNSGIDWTEDQVIADDLYSNEMAADIRVYRNTTSYVDLCYLNASTAKSSGLDIVYSWSGASYPNNFYSADTINDYPANWSDDGRKVCQIVPIITNSYPGIMYASMLLKEEGAPNLDASWNLYFDQHAWLDVGDDAADMGSPAQFSLSPNYPNPFNPETRIGYSLPWASHVKVEIFNILGQKIKTIVDEDQTIGDKEVIWDGTNENGEQVASGVYFYRLQAKDFVQTKKMVLMK